MWLLLETSKDDVLDFQITSNMKGDPNCFSLSMPLMFCLMSVVLIFLQVKGILSVMDKQAQRKDRHNWSDKTSVRKTNCHLTCHCRQVRGTKHVDWLNLSQNELKEEERSDNFLRQAVNWSLKMCVRGMWPVAYVQWPVETVSLNPILCLFFFFSLTHPPFSVFKPTFYPASLTLRGCNRRYEKHPFFDWRAEASFMPTFSFVFKDWKEETIIYFYGGQHETRLKPFDCCKCIYITNF